MKKFLQYFLFTFLVAGINACDLLNPEVNPKEEQCLNTQNLNSFGFSLNYVYNAESLQEIHERQNNDNLNSNYFTHNDKGQIITRSRFNHQTGKAGPTTEYTYNAAGKLAAATTNNENGDVSNITYTYDAQNYLKQMVSKTTKPDATVVTNYTVDFVWENGNNTKYTQISATQRTVREYTYNTGAENKLKGQQEKYAFNYITIQYNKHMHSTQKSTVTNLSTGQETVTDFVYTYDYNEAGYPVHVLIERISSANGNDSWTEQYTYECL